LNVGDRFFLQTTENIQRGFSILRTLRNEAKFLPPVRQRQLYAVGTVFKHTQTGKEGVIVRCDQSCNGYVINDSDLKFGTYQPYYYCFYEGSSSKECQGEYVPQELLQEISSKKISNPNIDAYVEFVDGVYVTKGSLTKTATATATATAVITPVESSRSAE